MENKIKLLNTSSSTYFANNRLDIGSEVPTSGTYNMGDIIIKSTQVDGEPIGWICIESGNPGVWNEFGGTIKIENPFTLEPGCIGNTELASEVKLKLLELENKDNAINSNITQVQTKVNQLQTNVNNQLNQLQANVNNQLTQLQTDVENNINPKINANTTKIGNLNNLNTENKNDLVAAINEVFQCGNNVKQNLVDALIAKNVECSTSDTFDTLITKVLSIEENPYPSWANDCHNKWLATGTAASISTARRYVCGGTVNDILYIIGGYTGSASKVVNSYNVKDNTVETKATLPTATYGSAAAVVNSKIYVIGGYTSTYVATNFCYNTLTNTWETKTPMTTTRRYCSAATVDKKIYVIGGYNGSYQSKNECYDPVTDTWSTKTPMTVAKYGHSSAVIDKIIYATGGYTGSLVKTHYAYDPSTDTWSTKTALTATRTLGTMVKNNGKLYYMGGSNNSTTYYKTNYQYDPNTNTWTTMTALPATRCSMTAGSVGNKIIISGGYNGSYLSSSEIYLV